MSDEFDSAQLDTSKWHVQGDNDFYYSNFTGRNTWRYETANARVENGFLKIETKYDPDASDLNHPNAKWSTAGVVSKNTILNGYMEIRARTTDAEVTSTFWTTGKTGTGSCFSTASCSELDVFEIYGRPTGGDPNRARRYWSSIHDWSQPGGPTTWTDKQTYLNFDPAEDFHTYGIAWDEISLNFHVDGVVIRTVSRQQVESAGLNGGVWAIDDPARIWVDTEIFEWMGVPPEDLTFSEDYEIDYIRTWQTAVDPVVLLGDCNQDGVVDFLDISPYIGVLSSGSFLDEADINQDTEVNFLDISPFIAILSGS